MGTLSGEPLYTAYGFVVTERVDLGSDGVAIPAVHMEKPIAR
jgi:hypothetical protein